MSNDRMLATGIAARARPVLARLARWGSAALPRSRCLLCQAPGDPLCADCRDELPVLSGPRCPICALPLAADRDRRCGRCQARPPAYDATLAPWTYAFPADALIQSLKYGHRLPAARFLGAALAELADHPLLAATDLLLPMPLHPQRLAERGFNQALEIARPLARRLGLEPALDICQRQRQTAPQAGLSEKARRGNLRGAFACRGDLAGRRVLVVDDVMTTGATLDELARSLKLHGAERVVNLVCARALRH